MSTEDSTDPAPAIRRRRGFLGVMLLLAALIAVVYVARGPLLRAAGWALVASDPLKPADVIVISIGAGGAAVLEAADLVQSGISTRVAVFGDQETITDHEFVRRGVSYYDEATYSVQQLQALGIASAMVVPGRVTGTEDEASVLPQWCRDNGYRTVIVISTPDHSRRTRRIMRRALGTSDITVIEHVARFSPFDPDNWWRSRLGTRTEADELGKLLLDVVRHP